MSFGAPAAAREAELGLYSAMHMLESDAAMPTPVSPVSKVTGMIFTDPSMVL